MKQGEIMIDQILGKMLNEGNQLTDESAKEFASELEAKIKEIFPSSHVIIRFKRDIGNPAIIGQFAVGKDNSEWDNGIIHNDPAFHQFWIWDVNSDSMRTELSIGGKVRIPGKDPIRVGWISKKGNKEAVEKSIINYFKKLKKIVEENNVSKE